MDRAFANPVVWFGALLGSAAVLVAALRGSTRLAPHRHALLFLAAGYAINFVPFALIKRPMYLSHYFIALIVSATFAYLAPMSYGWSLSAPAVVHRRWVIERRRCTTAGALSDQPYDIGAR